MFSRGIEPCFLTFPGFASTRKICYLATIARKVTRTDEEINYTTYELRKCLSVFMGLRQQGIQRHNHHIAPNIGHFASDRQVCKKTFVADHSRPTPISFLEPSLPLSSGMVFNVKSPSPAYNDHFLAQDSSHILHVFLVGVLLFTPYSRSVLCTAKV